MPLGPQDVVLAPPPSPPPNGLLRSAVVIEHTSEEHWGGQMVWTPENAQSATAHDPCLGGPNGVFLDGATTNASATFTSATAAFTGADVGMPITGTNIAPGTVIAAVTNPTTVTMSLPATGTGTGQYFAVYGRQTANNRTANMSFTPFVVDAYDACSTFGFAAADYEARARRALAAREAKAVSREWWMGNVFPTNPHLDNSGAGPTPSLAVTLAGGVAQSPRIGLGLLVQAIADGNGGVGMIHARPFLVTQWMAANLIRKESDGKIYTEAGVMIVPGRGYPGTGPAREAVGAATEWAYATDPVEVHRGPVEVFAGDPAQTMDRTRNQIVVRAERLYGIAWNATMNVVVNIDPTVG